MDGPVIACEGLGKQYGEAAALTDINLSVRRGTVLGILGHNGAGKTTLIDILSTRLRPTHGRAQVCGFDVVRHGGQVRRRIGVVGQFPAVDNAMTGRDNLVLVARLLGATARQAKERAEQLLTLFQLGDASDNPVLTYSGGMRRRLDLAAGLVGAPEVLFLDEPTTGLDPVSRAGLWFAVEQLAAIGTTVVLTTQYLDEADRLANEVIVLGLGQITVSGTPAELKGRLGSRVAMLTFASVLNAEAARNAINRLRLRETGTANPVTIGVALPQAADVTALVRALDTAGAPPIDFTVSEPTLDDVYLSLFQAAGYVGGGAWNQAAGFQVPAAPAASVWS